MEKAEAKYGALLDTCSAGTECRDAKKAVLVADLQQQWKTLLDQFYKNVQTTIMTSEERIETGYYDFVQCEVDHPCCETPETTVINWYKEIGNIKTTIQKLQRDRQILVIKL